MKSQTERGQQELRKQQLMNQTSYKKLHNQINNLLNLSHAKFKNPNQHQRSLENIKISPSQSLKGTGSSLNLQLMNIAFIKSEDIFDIKQMSVKKNKDRIFK